MSQKRAKSGGLRKGPPPRAGMVIDAVMTRTGNIDIRKFYAGPKSVIPEDIVGLVSGCVAALISSLFPNLDERRQAKELLLKLLGERIETAVETAPEADHENNEVIPSEGEVS